MSDKNKKIEFRMVSENAEVDGEIRMVDPSTVKMGPLGDPLTEKQKKRIFRIYEVFTDLDNSKIEDMFDQFQRDADPDSEIAIWEKMVKIFKASSAGRDDEVRLEIYRILLMRSCSTSREMVFESVKLEHLSKEEADEIMDKYETS